MQKTKQQFPINSFKEKVKRQENYGNYHEDIGKEVKLMESEVIDWPTP